MKKSFCLAVVLMVCVQITFAEADPLTYGVGNWSMAQGNCHRPGLGSYFLFFGPHLRKADIWEYKHWACFSVTRSRAVMPHDRRFWYWNTPFYFLALWQARLIQNLQKRWFFPVPIPVWDPFIPSFFYSREPLAQFVVHTLLRKLNSWQSEFE